MRSVALLLLGLVGLLGCKDATVQVKVKNGFTEPVSEVILHWEGQEVRVGALAPGETRSATIHPRDESPLRVSYRDRAGSPKEWSPGQRQHTAGPPIEVDLAAAGESY
jgi:hypothetical protein